MMILRWTTIAMKKTAMVKSLTDSDIKTEVVSDALEASDSSIAKQPPDRVNSSHCILSPS